MPAPPRLTLLGSTQICRPVNGVRVTSVVVSENKQGVLSGAGVLDVGEDSLRAVSELRAAGRWCRRAAGSPGGDPSPGGVLAGALAWPLRGGRGREASRTRGPRRSRRKDGRGGEGEGIPAPEGRGHRRGGLGLERGLAGFPQGPPAPASGPSPFPSPRPPRAQVKLPTVQREKPDGHLLVLTYTDFSFSSLHTKFHGLETGTRGRPGGVARSVERPT